MGIIAFVLIFGPWVALVALLWNMRDRFADARIDLFQRRPAKPAETKTPIEAKSPAPPSPIEPIAAIKPVSGPTPIAGDATLTGA